MSIISQQTEKKKSQYNIHVPTHEERVLVCDFKGRSHYGHYDQHLKGIIYKA